MASASSTRRQITGTSDESVDDAIARALSVASESFGEPDWFDVTTARGFISHGRVTHYQVTLDLGYEMGAGANADDYFRAACVRSMSSSSQRTVDIRF